MNTNVRINYRGMNISDGIAHIERHFHVTDLETVTCFSDLHEVRDANMTLPYYDDCNSNAWLVFVNAVIAGFDKKYEENTRMFVK